MPPDPSHPERIGRYRILEPIADGGMGRVYLAVLEGPSGFRKPVALKVLRPGAGEAVERTRTLLAEARLGGRLVHPHLVQTYELGIEDGHPFIAMELVEGPSVSELRRRLGQLPVRAALEVAIHAAAGLDHLHRLGLVHRDLKPGNLLVDRIGLTKVADFGLTQVEEEEAGKIRGTPEYMAPETARGDAATPRSDLFSLGLVLYELLTGSRFLPRRTRSEPAAIPVLHGLQRVDALLRRPGVLEAAEDRAPGIASVLLRVLARDPSLRHASASDLAHDLQRLLAAAHDAPLASLVRQEGGVAPRAGGSLPTLHTADLGPITNLPTEPELLLGREDLLVSLLDELAPGALLTLAGPGGIGKTRIAEHLGQRVLPRFPGGAWRVDGAVSGLCAALARALEVDASDAAQLATALAGEEACLLILDSAECRHDEARQLAQAMARAVPQSAMLVTTRVPLGTAHEQVIRVPPLDVVTARDLLTRRARALGVDLAPSDEEAIDDLLVELDLNPLALELAAARLRIGAKALLERLDRQLDLLKGRRPGRHGSLRTVARASWDGLSDPQRSALAQLSVFAGPFDRDAAAAVLETDDIDALLASLVHTSTLHPAPGDRDRFAPVRAVRALAAEHLDDLDRAAAEARHGAWYARFGTRQARTRLRTTGGEDLVRHRIEDRLELEITVDRALARGEPDQAALACTVALEVFERTGPIARGLALADRVLAAQGLADEQRIPVLELACWHRVMAHDMAGLTRDAERLRQLCAARDEPLPEASALSYLAIAAQTGGDADGAAGLFRQALALHERTGVRHNAAATMANLGQLELDRDRLPEARQWVHGALTTYRELGNKLDEAASLRLLAKITSAAGDLAEARQHLQRALTLVASAGGRRDFARTHGELGVVEVHSGNLVAARTHLAEAVQASRELGDATGLMSYEQWLGEVETHSGRHEAARDHLRNAESLARRIGDLRGLCGVLTSRAELEVAAEAQNLARHPLAEARGLVDRLGLGTDSPLRRRVVRLEHVLGPGGPDR